MNSKNSDNNIEFELDVLNDIAKNADIDLDNVKKIFEKAFTEVYHSVYKTDGEADLSIDEESGTVTVHRPNNVAYDEVKEEFALSSVHNVLYKEIKPHFARKKADDSSIYIGSLVSGVMRNGTFGSPIFVELQNGLEGILPVGEQVATEKYEPGKRMSFFVINVPKGGDGSDDPIDKENPLIVLSRRSPILVTKLFDREVPEISEGVIEIVFVARDAGSRSKVSVLSHNPNVNPTGTLIGRNKSRITPVLNDLEGEKIDIIKYDSDILKYIANALAPAKVIKVIPMSDASYTAVVPDFQFSLAIGKGGQNVRLAAQITKSRINVITDVDFDLLKSKFEAEQSAENAESD